ncbi:uncharacterized protein ISCGN_017514 [Ixodes scapularis]
MPTLAVLTLLVAASRYALVVGTPNWELVDTALSVAERSIAAIGQRRQYLFDDVFLGLRMVMGKWLIIVHAGSKEGFDVGAAEVFQAKKGSGDYHQEMNGQRFEEWFTKKLLPNLKPRGVAVMDNASYRSVKLHSLPRTSTKKLGIHQWLSNNGIASDMSMLKVELLNLVSKAKAARPELEKYHIDTIAEHHGHIVLCLPLYHCELNPIELPWSQVKGEVASQNQSFKIAEVEKLTPTALQNVSPENYAIDLEEQMWEADDLVYTVLDSIVINTPGDSDTDTCDEDEEMGSEPLGW